MISRRLLFSLFAGAGAIAAGAKVVEAAPAVDHLSIAMSPSDWRVLTTGMADGAHSHSISDPTHSHGYTCTMRQYQAGECLPTEESLGMMFPRGMLVSGNGIVPSVSDGQGNIVSVESAEGHAILKSIAAPHAGMSRW